MSRQRVYFAEACGKVKIGCSNTPTVRIGQLGEWIPFPIKLLATIPGNYALEAAIHRMFDDEWSHGEWFNASPRLLAFVELAASGRPLPIDTAQADTRRKAFIADKKRLTRKLGRLHAHGERLPVALSNALCAVGKGEPIPAPLLDRINAYLDERLSAERKRDKAA